MKLVCAAAGPADPAARDAVRSAMTESRRIGTATGRRISGTSGKAGIGLKPSDLIVTLGCLQTVIPSSTAFRPHGNAGIVLWLPRPRAFSATELSWSAFAGRAITRFVE